MLEITNFKLIDGGRNGITIKGRESVLLSGNYQVIDTISRERKLIMPQIIVDKVQQLKYYFLNCTGHWMTPFNNYYDMSDHKLKPIEADANGKIKSGQELLMHLWNKTEITGISYKNGGFVLTGTVEAVEGKKTVINTPFITEEDDLGFFSDAVTCIGDCIHEIVLNFNTHALPSVDPKNILSEEEMKGVDMSELTNLVVEKLVDRNMIMLVKDEGDEQVAIEEKTEKKEKVSKSTKSIDSKNLPEVKGDDDEESAADRAIRENLAGNQKDAFGKSASDTGMPDEFKSTDKTSPKDLEGLEHSENMGLGGEETNKEEKAEWEE